MVSRRKKIAAFSMGLDGHLAARNRFQGLVAEAVQCGQQHSARTEHKSHSSSEPTKDVRLLIQNSHSVL
ncbi:hypothetical protein E2C01_080309 [Portunus trituberculatus]|uniref:Uncharacterized protein n=1 Tax=Portunus trituberculatus TaxID=210409 RepID=A0A5B7ITR6_PORTR|nr:hypothetical protein [Portunus trituberculatus]